MSNKKREYFSYEEIIERVDKNIEDSRHYLLGTIMDDRNLSKEQKQTLLDLFLILTQVHNAVNPDKGSDPENPVQCQ